MPSFLSSPSTNTGPELIHVDAGPPVVTLSEPDHSSFSYYSILITNIFIFIVSSFGAVGNGMIIWVLGFSSKIYPFTVYILNLATADLGALLARMVWFFPLVLTQEPVLLASVYFQFFQFMCMASQLLLAAISLDRCLALLFMACHRPYQPGHLSIIICVLLWIISFLFSAVHFIRFSSGSSENSSTALYPLKVTALTCLPLWTIATMVLVVKGCCAMQQFSQHTLLNTILFTLTFSLLFALPLDVICIIASFKDIPAYILELGSLGACLSSSVNPVIYFFIGRKKRSQPRENIKITLQRIFQEGEDNREDMELELHFRSQL
ncbi:mas-related G-protein coupled receptor member X4-like [Candoia aspera]|uniref:mas-related G-protein coupled receptor member X4-like n=1 Tax=Candoia aspera TaxID=51853 RepID=UPI002FD7B462